jgi:hypothetical protein
VHLHIARIKDVGCWAHARWRFYDAQVTDRERALVGLGFIKKLHEADRVAMKLPRRAAGDRGMSAVAPWASSATKQASYVRHSSPR